MEELIQFLSPSARGDVKMLAMEQILGLTATAEGIATISSHPALLSTLVQLLSDPLANSTAALALINLSTDPTAITQLLSHSPTFLQLLMDRQSKLSDHMTMVLSNMTRDRVNCDTVYRKMADNNITLKTLVDILCDDKYNEGGCSLHYLGQVLSNLSQMSEVRNSLMNREHNLLERLLAFTQYQGSIVRRSGVVGIIRNCCFSTPDHEWLLGEDLNFLSQLVLPLAGPTPEDLADDEVEKLPMDLQYLDDDKKIEDDPEIRKMLLESLTQLCATRYGREEVRNKNIYVILRQLHGIEDNREVRLAAENIIDILIKTEEEIKIDNYKEVDVPESMHEKFKHMDEQYIN